MFTDPGVEEPTVSPINSIPCEPVPFLCKLNPIGVAPDSSPLISSKLIPANGPSVAKKLPS